MPRRPVLRSSHRADLQGTWYECAKQHLAESPIFLGNLIYCPLEGCDEKVTLVHSVWDDKESVEVRRKAWNSGDTPSIGKLIKQIEDGGQPTAEELKKVEEESEKEIETEGGAVE